MEPEYIISEATFEDLTDIAACHVKSFPKALSAMFGIDVVIKMMEWYLASEKRFLLKCKVNGLCVGYAGGIVADGSQIHGSASGITQFAFHSILWSLLRRPWLIFHGELISRYRLVLKNLYYRLISDNKPQRLAVPPDKLDKYVGLVVIGVLPEFRGNGIGSRLLVSFEEKAKLFGLSKAKLSVLKANSSAVMIYTAGGWKVIESRGSSFVMEKSIL